MKLTLSVNKLNSVAAITEGLTLMTERLRKLITELDASVEQSRSIIIAEQTKIETNRAEIDKAQSVIKNISALVEEKHE